MKDPSVRVLSCRARCFEFQRKEFQRGISGFNDPEMSRLFLQQVNGSYNNRLDMTTAQSEWNGLDRLGMTRRLVNDLPRRQGDIQKHCDSPCLCASVVQKIIAYLNNSFKPKSFYMKKLFFMLAVVILNSLIACNSDAGGMSATAKKNKEVNTAIMKAYESGDLSKMGDYIAADAVDHGGDTGDIKGLDSIVAAMKRYHDQTENVKTEVIREMADDEYVIVWSKVSGTAKVDMMGMKAGQSYTLNGVDIGKFKDGKAVEHWLYMDPKELAQMMMPSLSNTFPASDAIMTSDTAIMNPPKN